MVRQIASRVALKLKKIAGGLSPSEREFREILPFIESVEGFLVEGQERWLFDAARSLPDGANVIEIGSFKGKSTCCLAFGCRGTKKRVIALDPFDGGPDLPQRDSFEEFSRNIKRGGLTEYVEPIIGISTEALKTWKKPIHFLFIDGSHKYEDVLADFEGFYPHVAPGGLIACHDVVENWPGVFRAWHESIKHQLTDVGYCTTLGFGRKTAARAE
jgi:hypothetical protein